MLVRCILLLYILVLVESQKNLPYFPLSFRAEIVRNASQAFLSNDKESYLKVLLDNTNHTAYVGLYKISDQNSLKLKARYWLIYRPDGAPEDSDAALKHVLFTEEPAEFGDKKKKKLCHYTTNPKIGSGGFYPPINFPDHWYNGNDIQIKSWFDFPSDMIYRNKVTVDDENYDIWTSDSICNVDESKPNAPCHKLLASDEVPYIIYNAHIATPGTFESTWHYTDIFHHFGELDINIKPPHEDWISSCYNSQNGFNIVPKSRAFVSTPTGMDSFTVSLTTAPIQSLGKVKVKIQTSTEHCDDCLEIVDKDKKSLETITFDSSNWNKPVEVFIKYEKRGESYIYVVAEGGGYEVPHSYLPDDFSDATTETRTISLPFRVLTCEGQAAWGCDEDPSPKRNIIRLPRIGPKQ